MMMQLHFELQVNSLYLFGNVRSVLNNQVIPQHSRQVVRIKGGYVHILYFTYTAMQLGREILS